MSHFHQLRVVSHATWLAGELAQGAPHGLDVVSDLGFDIRPGQRPDEVAWWCPGDFAGRMRASGVAHTLRTPGARVLTRLPREFTGRSITVDTLGVAMREVRPGPVFAKPADTKLSTLPARVYDDIGIFAAEAVRAGLTTSSPVLVSDVTCYRAEFRLHVHLGQVVAASAYLVEGTTWDAMDPAHLPDTGAAETFGRMALEHMPSGLPDGYVLDVGVDAAGRWSVIEANPAWCANPYWSSSTRPSAVVDTILAAQGRNASGAIWTGDPAIAARARPLPVRTDLAVPHTRRA